MAFTERRLNRLPEAVPQNGSGKGALDVTVPAVPVSPTIGRPQALMCSQSHSQAHQGLFS